MIALLIDVMTPADVAALVALIVIAAGGVMAWWQFYAKPCRDSLRTIEIALMAAPWNRVPSSNQRIRSA
jgi:hypothetical protein